MGLRRAAVAPLLLLALLPLALAAGACGRDAPAPGYRGPVPGPAAQAALRELEGRGLLDATESFGGGRFTIGPFGVVQNPVTGKGPVVRLTRGTTVRWLPVLTDGDVADLWRRVTWTAHPALSGDLSPAYRAAWKEPR